MIKRSFFGFSKSYLAYDRITARPQPPRKISVAGQAVYILKSDTAHLDPATLAAGQPVKTGQKLALARDHAPYATSTVTGTVRAVEGFSGDFGDTWTRITVDVAADEQADETFEAVAAEPALGAALDRLMNVPGAPDLARLDDPEKPIHTLVINGVDRDLLTSTRQHVATAEIEAVTGGIHALRQITGVENVLLAVPKDIFQGYGHIGAKAVAVETRYPSGLDRNIMNDVLGMPVPAGRTCEDLGVCFMSAEAAASIGKAFSTGRVPVDKVVTVVAKDGTRSLVSARVGTPIRDIFQALGIVVNEKDRIIFGGPMTGSAVFSEDYPVEPDTDAIMVQDGGDIAVTSDAPCINCGECIRICPTRIPVNMLVRLLEAGHYEEAADQYDLHSCVDCGLCSFVCVSKIPIFQYISWPNSNWTGSSGGGRE